MDDIIIVWVVHCLICAIFAGTIGSAKGRSGGVYFFCGLLFGVFGLIFAAGVPTREAEALEKKRDADERERVRLEWERFAQEKKQAKLDKKWIAQEKKQAKLDKKQAK